MNYPVEGTTKDGVLERCEVVREVSFVPMVVREGYRSGEMSSSEARQQAAERRVEDRIC